MDHSVIYTTPYDSEVEYLESTTSQWIDTGVLFDVNKSISCNINVNVLSSTSGWGWGCIIGCETSTNAWNYRLYILRQSLQIGLKQHANAYTTLEVDKFINVIIPRNMESLTIDGTEYSMTEFPNKGVATNLTLYLFALNRGGEAKTMSPMRISSAKIWKQDILVRDFIPVRKGNVGYMYDKVSKQLFANKGTGSFILGQDVNNPVPKIRCVLYDNNQRYVLTPPYESKVEYLESTGTQYIKTDIIINSSDSVSVTLQFTEPNTPVCIWNARNTNPIKNTISLFRTNTNVIRFDYGKIHVGKDVTINNLSIIHEYKSVANKLYVDGVLKATYTANSFTAGKSVMVLASFHSNSSTIITNFAYAKLYSVKITNSNNEVLCDLIPVRIATKGYMYDKISGKLFSNQGSGNFTLGNDIN